MKNYYISINSLGEVTACELVDNEDIMFLLTGTKGDTIEKVKENVIKIISNYGYTYYLITTRKDIIGAIQIALEFYGKGVKHDVQ